MENKRQLIYVDDAKRAIEHYDPAFACVIDNAPTVDAVEVVHGRWIVDEDGNFCNVKCSACGKDYACHYGMLQLQNFGYCPNCGAKMDGGK